MTDRVFAAILEFHMLPKQGPVVVGVSGGADSMALLHFLWNGRQAFTGLQIIAAHVNHCLRGGESDRDEAFVRKYCEQNQIPLEVLKTDVAKEAAALKIGLEECGRRLRYGFFEALAGETGRIATAHTLSDLTETVLFNLARGTGLKGLCGIPPVRGNIIRPLIRCTREEIEGYCAENQVPYVTDSTNLSGLYARNKIRLQVVPVLKSVNPGLEEAVGRMADSLRRDAEYLEKEARALLDSAKDGEGVRCQALRAAAKPVRVRAIRMLACGRCKPEAKHLEAIDRLVLSENGAVSVPGEMDFKARRGKLLLVPHKKRRIPQ